MGVLLGLVPPTGPPVSLSCCLLCPGLVLVAGEGTGGPSLGSECAWPLQGRTQQIIDLSSRWQGKKATNKSSSRLA